MSNLKVVRLLVYEGEERWVKETLAKSLPDGVKSVFGINQIKVITLGSLPNHADLLLPGEI